MNMKVFAALVLAIMVCLTAVGSSGAQSARPGFRGRIIPLCPGLTIVTAITQLTGDYESIKRIESATADMIRVRYSSYMPDPKHDYDSTTVAPAPWVPYNVFRNLRITDLDNAAAYMQQFVSGIPETIKNTTALGISTKVYRALKEKGTTPMTIYLPPNPGSISDDGEPTFSLMDPRLFGEISRADIKPSTLTVLVNDRPTALAVLHAKGSIDNHDAEFFFLDDPENPLSLKFEVGTDTLQVIKISHSCAVSVPDATTSGGGAGASRVDFLERALADKGRVDVYSIFFAFNSDVIREESAPTLQDVASILKKHPDWKLSIEGHTDGIASDTFNLDLSKRRAAAVKVALAQKYGVEGGRLSTTGFGKAHPRDTNETLEGRARNRRVELVRQ
jgi:outer membrane protein OmpA-like peptidoglycan-associated protein